MQSLNPADYANNEQSRSERQQEAFHVKVTETSGTLEESSESTVTKVDRGDLDEEAELLLNHPQIIESFEKYPWVMKMI